ncbi:hypothetical protein LCI18_012074 [Fusarium solani-melongenae]|uniref:Uncharacterized protein n=1 Tax=Fusarium solani subsp. cucurbitae TaxID=2747967 RepID=A0ACD3ZIH6_FUSSC|nr:hypothetical protein LCI18_012074 [Fusarium solani-melongenae]
MDLGSVWSKYFVQLVLRRFPLPPSRNGRQIPFRMSYLDPASLVDERRRAPYISNAIRTTTYTVWDFLPRQLAIPGLSTTGSFTTLIPLVVFITLIIAKEGYYDWKRHRQDVIENNRPVTVLRRYTSLAYGTEDFVNLQWVTAKWRDLKVGEVIKLSSGHDVPADLVLLHSSSDRGLAFVETMALDGETNLKAKRSPANLGPCSTIDDITQCEGVFSIEDPNADLYRFDSKFTSQGRTLPLTLNEAIYRGSVIRNTPEVVCIVVNTGEECKVRMNSKMKAKTKKPRLERITNNIVLSLILFIAILSTLFTVTYNIWKDQSEKRAWYLFGSTVPMVQIFFGFVIMFNNVIPLSLYVGLEGIKIGQMNLVNNDVHLYDEKSDTPARVNTTNNLDDLGQIGYLFTDKTGTLTDNIMNVRKLSVAGTSWLHQNCPALERSPTAKLDAEAGELTTRHLLEHVDSDSQGPFAFHVNRFILAMALCHTCLPISTESGEIDFQASSPDELALVRAAQEMGYSVVNRSPESTTIHITDTLGNIERLEFQILDVVEFSSKRKRMSIIVRCPDGTLWLICKGADSIILPRLAMAPRDMIDDLEEVSSLSESTSRYSVALRSPWRHDHGDQEWVETSDNYGNDRDSGPNIPPGEHMIPLRDNIVQNSNNNSFGDRTLRAVIRTAVTDSNEEGQCIRQSFAHMHHYATEGLRTLVYAGRRVSEREYQDWKRLYQKAETSLHNRQERIEKVGELLEKSLHFLGVSAVEDKLQHGVPDTIEKLRRAQVKIWMLTGDKKETAISIAHSARICGPNTSLYMLDVTAGDLEAQVASIADSILYGGDLPTHSVVVIDGSTLAAIEKDPESRLRRLFYELAPNIGSVVCCRASPSQKALLVRIIGSDPLPKVQRGRSSWLWPRPRPRPPLTLAIGDGANDMPMILTASVGVGISGREGQQAARVADFSISQFRFLARLMLVHGRWNYYRTTRFILVTFWKEVLFYFPQAIFQAEAGSTGTSLYHSQALMFTSYLTAAVILVIGLYEQDLKATTLLTIPELYVYGQNGEGLTTVVYLGWISNALVAGFVIFAVGWAGYSGGVETVYDNGLYAQGALVFACCMIWTNYKVLILEMHHKTKIALWSAFASILAVWVYLLVTAAISGYESGPYTIKGGMIQEYGRDPSWWFALLYALGLLIAAESAFRSLRQNAMVRALAGRCLTWFGIAKNSGKSVREGYKDWDTHLWQEMEKDKAVRRRFRDMGNGRKRHNSRGKAPKHPQGHDRPYHSSHCRTLS